MPMDCFYCHILLISTRTWRRQLESQIKHVKLDLKLTIQTASQPEEITSEVLFQNQREINKFYGIKFFLTITIILPAGCHGPNDRMIGLITIER